MTLFQNELRLQHAGMLDVRIESVSPRWTRAAISARGSDARIRPMCSACSCE